jgi:hypothetical protein
MSISSRKVGGFSGLAFVVTVLIVNIIQGATGHPMAGAAKGDVFDFYADNGGMVGVINAVSPIVWFALIFFAGGVVAAARSHERSSGDSWSLVGLGGTVMQNAIFAGVIATEAVLASGELSQDAGWAVWYLHSALFSLNTMALAIVLVALSVGAARAGLIPAWHRTLGLASAAALAASSMATPLNLEGSPTALIGLAGFIGWLVWIGATSLRLLRPATVEVVEPVERELAHAE